MLQADIDYAKLHEGLLDLTGLLDRPQPDALLLRQAGVSLDRALFPILSRVELREAITIDELADLAGRDQSTVSRQVAKLEQAGLVTRRVDPADHRRRMVAPTAEGRRILDDIHHARNELLGQVLRDWSAEEQEALIESITRFSSRVRLLLPSLAAAQSGASDRE